MMADSSRVQRVADIAASVNWDSRGLVPVVVQDVESSVVLMLAYANVQALERTLDDGYAHFYSRSRQELWKKGATSGNLQRVVEVRLDCDGDALLYLVEPRGPACHTGHTSCFYRGAGLGESTRATPDARLLSTLFQVIEGRKDELPEGSYVARLMQGHPSELLRKIGEEATEVMLAAVEPGQKQLVPEVADLVFHSLVVLSRYGYSLDEVLVELESRRR